MSPHQEGTLRIQTELGLLVVEPGELAVIPQNIRYILQTYRKCSRANSRYAVHVDGASRGYICEVFGTRFTLPNLGPIGANGLANPRDFEYPTAFYVEQEVSFRIFNKYQGKQFVCEQDHSCFDVVGWHGNYSPYKYNMWKFSAVNSVTFDHMDPSIFTVLTAPSLEEGTAVVDLAIFPPRWSVHEHTFRPPYYHRNVMRCVDKLILVY